MNHLSNLAERQRLTKAMIESELNRLKKGYNPISDEFVNREPVQEDSGIVGPKTKFIHALKMAQSSLNLEGFTKDDMAKIVENIAAIVPKVCVDGISVDDIQIYEIKKRHIRALFNKMATDNKWSAHSWNKYRYYLMMLFKELGEYDAVESNIPREISKRKTVKRIRTVLSPEERKR